MSKKNKEDKDLSIKKMDELFVDLENAKKNLFSLRYNKATKELKDVSLLRKCKKNIARIKTVISYKIKGVVND